MSKFMDETDEELNERLKSWNPMLEDYTNSAFNQYISGPGAQLDANLQPAALAKLDQKSEGSKKPSAYLLVRNIPKGMTHHALGNLCSSHGRVLSIRGSKQSDQVLVFFASVADMEAVYRRLQKNDYGLKAVIGRPKDHVSESKVSETPPPFVSEGPRIDRDNRRYFVSDDDVPRPEFEEEPFVDDAAQHILPIADDAHALERAGLEVPHEKIKGDENYVYRSGSAHKVMDKKTKEFIERKCRESEGSYDSEKDMFENSSTHLRPKNLGNCIECGKLCDMTCGRCKEYYCSRECQQTDWPKHRVVCGKPKELQAIPNEEGSKYSSMVTKSITKGDSLPTADEPPSVVPTSAKNDTPPSGSIVVLSSITKTNVVFIRSKEQKDNLLYFKTISAIRRDIGQFKPVVGMPPIGKIVVAKCEGQYNRALVLGAIDSDKVKLCYVDFGNLGVQRLENLLEPSKDYSMLPRFAVPVILKGVPDYYMTAETKNFMYSYLDRIDLCLKYDGIDDYDTKTGVYKVELIDNTTSQNFNEMILNIATPKIVDGVDNMCFREFLSQAPLPTGHDVELRIMDNTLLQTRCLSCTTTVYALEVKKFEKDLQRFGNSIPKRKPYAPRPNELCIAKYSDNKWYRGRCLELVGDGFPSIVFFDYGNIASVDIKDILPYPPQFTFPVYTVDCEIDDLPETCSPELLARLGQLLPMGGVITCTEVKYNSEEMYYAIKIPQIIETLKSEGLMGDEEASP